MKDSEFEIKVRLTKESSKSADPLEVLEAVTMDGRINCSVTQKYEVLDLTDDVTGNEKDC